MHLYERFEVSDNFDGADGKPVRSWDTAFSTSVVIYRGRLRGASRREHLAQASALYDKAIAQAPSAAAFELFTTEGSLWLVAPSENEAAPLVSQLRKAALLPSPAVAPPPPPPAPKCIKCGAVSAAAGQLCSNCAKKSTAKKSPLKPLRIFLGFVVLALAIFVISISIPNRETKPESPSPFKDPAYLPSGLPFSGIPKVSFTSNFSELPEGGIAELQWNTTNATRVSINQGIGEVKSSGTRRVKLTATTRFELTASGIGGTITSPLTINVTPAAVTPAPDRAKPPEIALFTTDQTTVRQHETVHLRWITHGATSLSIEPLIGDPGESNSAAVTLDQTTTFTLTARGEGGAVTRPLTVEVIPAVPTAAISANNVHGNTTVMNGDVVRLCWQTSYATQVTVSGQPVRTASDCENVIPPRTTTYTISASGPGGQAASEVLVVVLPRAVSPRPAPRAELPPTPSQQTGQPASGELTWSGYVGGDSTHTIDIQMQWNAGASQWQPMLSSGGSMSGIAIPYPIFWMSCISDEGGRIGPQLVSLPRGGGPIRIHYTFQRAGNHRIRIHWEKIPDIPTHR